MKEEDVARLAYASIVRSVEETNRDLREEEIEHTVDYPDVISVNGKVYGFGLVDANFLDNSTGQK